MTRAIVTVLLFLLNIENRDEQLRIMVVMCIPLRTIKKITLGESMVVALVGALAGLLVSMPVIFWQIWSFIAPGLYQHEKRYIVPFVLVSSLCFATGAFFGYRFVFPMAFKVLIEFGTGSGDLSAMLSMGSYLSLSSKLLLAFGLVFELPVVIFFLARMGIVDHKMLARNRKFALLAAFLTGAMLTPPDVFSQTALALPFIILYEVGIIVARLFGKRKEAAVDSNANAAPAE